MWNHTFIYPPDIQTLFNSWMYLDLSHPTVSTVAHGFLCSCLVDLNLLQQNHFVPRGFQPKHLYRALQIPFSLNICIELFKYHFACWSKKVWGSIVPSVSDICRTPKEVLIPLSSQPIRLSTSWVPSSSGFIKINVSGSYFSDSNRSELRVSFGTIPET